MNVYIFILKDKFVVNLGWAKKNLFIYFDFNTGTIA